MRVNGVELDSREIAGAEPALVCLHEGLGSVGLWRDFPQRLASAIAVVGTGRPGKRGAFGGRGGC